MDEILVLLWQDVYANDEINKLSAQELQFLKLIDRWLRVREQGSNDCSDKILLDPFKDFLDISKFPQCAREKWIS